MKNKENESKEKDNRNCVNTENRNNLEKENEQTKLKNNNANYGEFISSYFAWVSPEKQKQNAGKLENLENNKDNEE